MVRGNKRSIGSALYPVHAAKRVFDDVWARRNQVYWKMPSDCDCLLRETGTNHGEILS
jgi:hypothetical protein